MNGLWTAEFGSSTGVFGGGVAVFEGGKIRGGDATHYYLGDYTIDGDRLKATLRVIPYIEGARSVFNTVGRNLTLDIEGTLEAADRVIAQGRPRELPSLSFGVKLTRRG